jgi:hypothetical protein
MTETKAGTAPAQGPAQESAEEAEKTHQADGRYIPYSGGSLGWHENSGVASRERRNNYGFHTAIDGELVKAKQYLRSGLRAEKRRSSRRKITEEMPVVLHTDKETKTGRVYDISKHGIRVMYIGDDILLKTGDQAHVRFPDSKGAIVLDLLSTVVRSWKAGRTRTLWNYGIAFPLMKEDQLAKLIAYAGLTD